MLPTQLEKAHYAKRGTKRDFTQTERILFQLPTRGLSLYVFQVLIQWQNFCLEWKTPL